MKKLIEKPKSYLNNERGGALIENKLILVLGAIIIFGVGSLAITFVTNYWNNTVQKGINDQGTMNKEFGKTSNFGTTTPTS